MMALADKLGRQAAHEILRQHAAERDFVGALKSDARISGVLSSAELDLLLDPSTYVGLAPTIVDAVVEKFGVRPAAAAASAAGAQ